MVQTRLAAKRIKSSHVSGDRDHNTLQEDRATNLALEDGVPVPVKTPGPCRADAAPAKRRRGKPGELCQLNLDVLFLIAAYIHPIDLLNLARTCRSLRELLMDRSSAFVWKTTFRHVKGLPSCPADLTEPEYANLVFYARCHGCGKYTATILWGVRRRYCPGCKIRRLRRLSSCNAVIRENGVLAAEHITIKKEASIRVDRDQVASFMHEYNQSPDKKIFIFEKQKERSIILKHAKKCEAWQKKRDLERKRDWKKLQEERRRCMFQRLERHGYSREINYFGATRIQRTRESDFRTSRPLTDKEWEKILPAWVTNMNNFRSQRLQNQVYGPRRQELVLAYNEYVRHPSADTPTFDLLPHVADLARFPPFRDIIHTSEDIRVNQNSFEFAFTQLPGLVSEWKKQLDTELAELMKIPLKLSNSSSSQVPAPSSTSRAESLNADLDKLRLACALFQTADAGVFTYLEVFSVSMLDRHQYNRKDDLEGLGSISNRFDIHFLEEAPYIVHACGLDPNVATVADMDYRNARLKCLACEGCTLVMNWRHAMWHAHSSHQGSRTLPRLSKLPRWQPVSDEYIDAIQTIEQSIKGGTYSGFVRCLFCRPTVRDVIKSMHEFVCHLYKFHNVRVESREVKEGEHYAPVGIFNSPSVAVEMVEEGDHITFRVPPK